MPRILRALGLLTLLVGGAFLLLSLAAPPAVADPGSNHALGVFDATTSDPQCPTDATACAKFKITGCPGLSDNPDGFYSRYERIGAWRGVLVIFAGGSGNAYWSKQGDAAQQFITDVRNAGIEVFQVRWGGVGWLTADSGQDDGLHVGCRPATAAKWLHDQKFVAPNPGPAAQPTGACGFCVMGTSGGASAVSWMVTHFGGEAWIDAAFPTGGPPHAAMAKGCAPTATELDYDYGPRNASSISQLESPFRSGDGKHCTNLDASFRPTWDANSVDTPQSQGDHNHPNTRVFLLDGGNDELRIHGWDFSLRMQAEPATAYHTFRIVPGMPHAVDKSPDGLAALKAAVLLTDTNLMRACNNGVDDDLDGLFDGSDPGCSSTSDASEKGLLVECDNGLDDDADGFIDFRTEFGDSGCSSASDTTESGGGSGPVLSIADLPSISEGHSGTTNAMFPVTLSASSTSVVTVQFSTTNGTALAPDDYTAVSGSPLTFNPGETSKNAIISVMGDVLDEPNQTFNVVLSNPAGATIADGTAVGTIVDDDATPTISVNDLPSIAEGNSDSTNAGFTVTLTGASEQTVTVQRATANGTATAGSDYTALGLAVDNLTWVPGTTGPKTVNVAILGDTLDEENETFQLNLSTAANATIADGQGIGTITDDDATPSLTVPDPAAFPELNAGSTARAFTVQLSAVSGRPVSASYVTSDGSATSGSDYTATSGVLTIPAGSASGTINVSILGDVVDEDDETFTLTLSAPSNATIGDDVAVATINDDDTSLISIDNPTVAEGNPPDTPPAVFTLTLSTPNDRQVTVQRATADDTATAGEDYAALASESGPVTFAAFETSKQVAVSILPDSAVEEDETFHLNLSGAVNATIADSQGTATIINDDDAPSVSINDPEPVLEGDPPATPSIQFTVTLSEDAGSDVTVDWATESGTGPAAATEDSDFAAAGGIVTFTTGGSLTQPVVVPITSDIAVEPTETFVVRLSNSTNAEISDATGTGTITNDDNPSALSVVGETDTEGSAVDFLISLTPAPKHQVTVTYTTSPGTATAGSDYTPATSVPVVFAAGDGSETVSIATVDDALDEADTESFTLTVGSSDPDVTGAPAQATGNIADDDDLPSLAIADAEDVAEGALASFTITLSPVSGRNVTVSWATAPNSATAGDFTAVASTPVTFTPGETSKTVSVQTTQDSLGEDDESFFVNLSSESNATVVDGQATATIIDDDDDVPTVSIGDAEVVEGTGTDSRLRFPITLSSASPTDVTVTFSTQDGTAVAPGDYKARSGFSATIPAGSTSRTIAVVVKADSAGEGNETFTGKLDGATGAVIADNLAVGTIIDDDTGPPPGITISISDKTVTEPDTTNVGCKFKITLSATSTQTITVHFTTADGSATAGSDYTSKSATATFNPGQKSKTVSIQVRGDVAPEPDETFFGNLSSPTNATIADGQGVCTILNND